jgi:hypothetical protein
MADVLLIVSAIGSVCAFVVSIITNIRLSACSENGCVVLPKSSDTSIEEQLKSLDKINEVRKNKQCESQASRSV